MKKAKIALASIALLGIAGSIVAFRANLSKFRPAYYTYQWGGQGIYTFTKASAILGVGSDVYYTLIKYFPATIYASLEKNN